MVVKSGIKERDFLKNNDIQIKFCSLIFRFFETKEKPIFFVSPTTLKPKDLSDSLLINAYSDIA